MKIKLLYIIIAFFGLFNDVYSQSYYHNLQKYWWYRYRLVNDFMKIRELEKAYIIQ